MFSASMDLGKDKVVSEILSRLRAGRDGNRPVEVEGSWGSFAPLLAAYISDKVKRPILYICPHIDDADDVFDDLQTFCGKGKQIETFPAWEAQPQFGDATDETGAERLRIALHLAGLKRVGKKAGQLIITTCIQALIQPIQQTAAVEQNALTLRRGGTIAPEEVIEWLVEHAFERVDSVDLPGQFARRGGIVDIYAPVATVELKEPGEVDGGFKTSPPVRIEFFGDTIESIRTIDLDTQRSSSEVNSISAVPPLSWDSIKSASGAELFINVLPEDTLIILAEPVDIEEVAGVFLDRVENPSGLFTWRAIYEAIGSFRQLHICRFAAGRHEQFLRLDVKSCQQFEHKAGPLIKSGVWAGSKDALQELVAAAKQNKVLLYCTGAAEIKRVTEIITQNSRVMPKNLQLRSGFIHRGFIINSLNTIVISHHEIFGQFALRRRIRPVRAASPVDTALDLHRGDYVVHVSYGIGKFLGVKTIRKRQAVAEYLSIEYADKTVIHVPVQNIYLVQKYIGTSPKRPPLSKLGSKKWQKQKEKAANAVKDLAGELLGLQAQRESIGGIAYDSDSAWQREFEQVFLYQETPDQITVAEQIKADMQRAVPMDRLLCGDVGYGKTELAMRAAFKTIQCGKQVAVLVPTTVLCAQHGRTFGERFADFPVIIETLNRFKSPGQAKDIIKRTRHGRVDVLIGTHRLLSKDIGFKDLGLLIIDEEQRFGVEHKEKLKKLRVNVDVLTMTATPIPRTLHMSLLGLRDISSLTTPPMDRRSIVTTLCRYNSETIRKGILRELNRQGQVFFLHNRVRSIERIAHEIGRLVSEARIAIAHGQMPKHELEKAMIDFVLGKTDVLVCSAIIQSGLDIPNANTIFINDADRFGLAELHQLRGRVGRYKFRAYSYMLLPSSRTITPTAAKRLKAIEEYSQLGAGFRIALRDLEIRGAGNILGPQQSGHIQAVGYEMYCKLLAEAIKRSKNEPVEPEPSAVIDLGFAGFIPKSYIASDRQRLDIYRRIAAAGTTQDLKQLESDLTDLFGKIPQEARVLLDIAELRILASACNVKSLVASAPPPPFAVCDSRQGTDAGAGQNLTFSFKRPENVGALFERAPGVVRITDPQTVRLHLEKSYFEPETLLAVLRKIFSSTS